jgi:hypothetical protein
MVTFISILLLLGLVVFLYFQFGEEGLRSLRSHGSDKKRFERAELTRVLMGLNDEAVNELMIRYREEFGPGPARYARRTYNKWRSGEVRPATQTFERFLLHLPKVISFDLKCEILRHFMEEFAAKEHYELIVHTDDWEYKLTPLIKQIIDKAFTAQLPIEVERKLRWLGENDMQAAQELLRASQAMEAKIMVSMLREEFEHIERILAEEHLKPLVTHVLEFPYGTIKLKIKRRTAKNGR